MEAVVFIGLQRRGNLPSTRNASAQRTFASASTYCELGLSVSQKNELLFQYGINFNDLPNWQKRGVGLYWKEYDKPSVNPITNEEVTARRRRIRTDFDLPMKGQYGEFVRSFSTKKFPMTGRESRAADVD